MLPSDPHIMTFVETAKLLQLLKGTDGLPPEIRQQMDVVHAGLRVSQGHLVTQEIREFRGIRPAFISNLIRE